jgi:FHIPEP family
MDGASKFVRGDAIAGLLVLLINVIGGMVIGIMQQGLSFAEAGHAYTLLSVGDGLVTQVPVRRPSCFQGRRCRRRPQGAAQPVFRLSQSARHVGSRHAG